MADESDGIPTGALEDVAYLSRSANRVRILDALVGGPYTRRELAELTGTSRTTLDRIVNELEERGWTERTTDGDYVATPTGDHLMAQVRPFLESVQAIRQLDEALTWLPDELSGDLHQFSDATVRRPEGEDPMEAVDYFVDLVRDSAELAVLTHLAPPVPIARAVRDGLTTSDLRVSYVLTGDLVDYLSNQPDRRERWRGMVEDGADMYRYDGHVPCNLFVFDETVLVKKSGPGPIQESYGAPIVSDDATVRSWASDVVDRYRADAAPVDTGTFADEQGVRQAESADR